MNTRAQGALPAAPGSATDSSRNPRQTMELASKVVLITGTRRIGAVVAAAVAKRGADVVLLYNRSRGEAEEAGTPCEPQAVARSCFRRMLPMPTRCDHVVASIEPRPRPARRGRQHGVGVSLGAVRRPDAGGMASAVVGGSARHVSRVARGRASHAPIRAAAASSISRTGSRQARGPATRAMSRITWRKPA